MTGLESAARLTGEALRIIEEASKKSLILRACGGVGLLLRLENRSILEGLGRDPFRDIDLVGVSERRAAYRRFFDDLDYEVDRDLLIAGEGKRYSFQRRDDPTLEVDLFIDRLDMCHPIELRSRMTLHPHTIPLADILLQKLQIVEPTRKDVVDVAALLASHELDDGNAEGLDAEYVCHLLAEDWGFCHTVLINLDRTERQLDEFALDPRLGETIRRRLGELRTRIDSAPKSRRWRLRAKIGTKKKWYQDVGEGTEAF
jgi:hypothetical protein